MIKLLLGGVWGAAVALVAAYVAMNWSAGSAVDAASGGRKPALQQIKADQMSVPIIADGKIQGYVLAQFTFTVDGAQLKRVPSPIETFLSDETFRSLYADGKIDFRRLKKQDLAELGQTIVAKLNKRLGADVVVDAFVQDFNYVPIEAVRSGALPNARR